MQPARLGRDRGRRTSLIWRVLPPFALRSTAAHLDKVSDLGAAAVASAMAMIHVPQGTLVRMLLAHDEQGACGACAIGDR